jgi:hypothetical protein
MKTKIFIFFFLILTVLQSCEDAFTTIKEIDIPEHDSKLSVFADLSENKASFSVSYSKIITENYGYKPINAEITILENGIPFYKTSFIGTDDSSFSEKYLGKIITEGKEYTLIVENSTYGKATAKQTVPRKPDFSNLKYKEDGFINPEGYKADLLSFDINDDASVENYYMVEGYGIKSYGNEFREDPLYLNSEDPSLKEFWFGSKIGFIIADKNFNGSITKILTNLEIYNQIEKIKLKVSAITKDYYHFLLSYKQYQEADGNPFAEPVNVHNNIENGYGLFQVNSSKEIILDIE